MHEYVDCCQLIPILGHPKSSTLTDSVIVYSYHSSEINKIGLYVVNMLLYAGHVCAKWEWSMV